MCLITTLCKPRIRICDAVATCAPPLHTPSQLQQSLPPARSLETQVVELGDHGLFLALNPVANSDSDYTHLQKRVAPALVVLETKIIEVGDDVLGRRVVLDHSVPVEQHHVAR